MIKRAYTPYYPHTFEIIGHEISEKIKAWLDENGIEEGTPVGIQSYYTAFDQSRQSHYDVVIGRNTVFVKPPGIVVRLADDLDLTAFMCRWGDA